MKIEQQTIQDLVAVGLTEQEAIIYCTVARLGEASAGMVLEVVTMYREQVYRVLKRLVEEGLLLEYQKRKRNYYGLADPGKLTQQTEDRLRAAKRAQEGIAAMQQGVTHRVEILHGTEALGQLLEDILLTVPRGGEYLVIGGEHDLFYEHAETLLPKYARDLKKRGISFRILAYPGQNYRKELDMGSPAKVRLLTPPIALPSSVLIYGSNVVYEIFAPDQVDLIRIENKDLAASYVATFERAWRAVGA